MQRVVSKSLVIVIAMVGLWILPHVCAADDDLVAKVKGGGVAAFDEGEEAFGLETLFNVKAAVRNRGRATGDFYCELPGVIAIVGEVHRGRANRDGSVTLEGLACWFDPDGGVISQNEFFIVTLWPGGPGRGRFLYIDSFTGPAGDAETVTEGRIRIRHDD